MTDPRFAGRAIPEPLYAEDDGSADPQLSALVAAYAEGSADAAPLVRLLASTRLLVPVVAVLEESETGPGGVRHEKTSAMASVTVVAPDGRRSLLAFSGTEALRAWRADARPIAAPGRQVAQAALAEGADRLLVDAAGPVAFGLAGAELRALALAEDPAAAPHTDPSVRAAVAAACRPEPLVLQAVVQPGDPSGVRVVTVVDDAVPLAEFRALVPRLQAALAADPLLRARAGALQVALVPPAGAPAPGDGVVAFRRG